MSDALEPTVEELQGSVIPSDLGPTAHGASKIASFANESEVMLQVVEERLNVVKQRKTTGSVRVRTFTQVVEAVAEAELDRYRVEVTRVPVGCVVDEAPLARAEGDTTIVPVVEERFVVVKQLFLVEELRIRHVLERKYVSEPLTLRRQRAVVERLNRQGEAPPENTTSREEPAHAAEGGQHGSV